MITPSDNSFKTNNELPDFSNTQIAFQGKSNNFLNKSYWLFKAMSSPALTKMGMRVLTSLLNVGLPIVPLIKKTIFAQFCGGETITECEATINDLARNGVGTILDYSVEGEQQERSFINTTEEILTVIRKSKDDKRIPLAVFKPTGLGRFDLYAKVTARQTLTVAEQAEYFKVKARFNQICKLAHDMEVPVMIDAEESWIQGAIDNIALDMMRMYNRDKTFIYNTYQLYRSDKLASLKADIYLAATDEFKLGAKLVRGAYMEKERERAALKGYPSPIHKDKASTDADFNEAIRFCMEHVTNVSFIAGTHNEESCTLLSGLMQRANMQRDASSVYFAQLLGMSDHLSNNLAHGGYNVAKYVPYGPVKAVLPYLFRRAEENTSIAGQTGRELSLIVAEKKRRKVS